MTSWSATHFLKIEQCTSCPVYFWRKLPHAMPTEILGPLLWFDLFLLLIYLLPIYFI